MTAPTDDNRRRGQAIAEHVLQGFEAYRKRFREITRGAEARFEAAAWADGQAASMARIESYAKAVGRVVSDLRLAGQPSLAIWRAARDAYPTLCEGRGDRELAETFFNSIYCRLWDHEAMLDENLFIRSLAPPGAAEPADCPTRTYEATDSDSWAGICDQLLTDYAFAAPWEDSTRDAAYLKQAIDGAFGGEAPTGAGCSLTLLAPVFFRNKGAYLVGEHQGRRARHPVAIAIMNNEAGALIVDAMLTAENDLSMVFSFTRSYFLVDTPNPAALVAYLHTLLPGKPIHELYTALGFYRHGKTEFYRDFLTHLDQSEDPFILAPGIKGMVMAVFMLPSFQTVFKIIKDRFPPQKHTSRSQVIASYELVKLHDRVGRMADTQEFTNLRLPRHRFDPTLLEELLAVAAESVTLEEDAVVIHHCYTERQMTPLNLYLEEANEEDLRSALDEYGNAIRQLAAANIFPGDMLLKNFGITRHGRVVFYDYDEISYLTEVNFREIPEPRTPEEEMAAEPWYSVGPHDVFPEEFPRFLFAKPRIKRLFTQLHGEIFDAAYWRGLQASIQQGSVMDVYPYRRRHRFAERFTATENQEI